jgi:hypothetical protein
LDAFTSSGKYVGTKALGRPLTKAESQQLAALLRRHDFVGASMVALRFAYKRAGGRQSACDVMGRINRRLVETGWDPNEVPLVKRLCRLVWSECHHDLREKAAARRAEEVYLREREVPAEAPPAAPQRGDPLRPPAREPVAPSYEHSLARLDAEATDDARRARELDAMRKWLNELRAGFRAKGDEANLVYLEQHMKGNSDLQTMARVSGLPVEAFYAAQKRRKRAVEKIIAEKAGAARGGEENS